MNCCIYWILLMPMPILTLSWDKIKYALNIQDNFTTICCGILVLVNCWLVVLLVRRKCRICSSISGTALQLNSLSISPSDSSGSVTDYCYVAATFQLNVRQISETFDHFQQWKISDIRSVIIVAYSKSCSSHAVLMQFWDDVLKKFVIIYQVGHDNC